MADEVKEAIEMAEPEDGKRLLSVAEAAEFAERCKGTIRTWIHQGLLTARKVGVQGNFQIRKKDLEAALTYEPPCVKDEQ